MEECNGNHHCPALSCRIVQHASKHSSVARLAKGMGNVAVQKWKFEICRTCVLLALQKISGEIVDTNTGSLHFWVVTEWPRVFLIITESNHASNELKFWRWYPDFEGSFDTYESDPPKAPICTSTISCFKSDMWGYKSVDFPPQLLQVVLNLPP